MQQEFKVEELTKYVEEHFDTNLLPSLMDYVRIDNLSRSYDPEWNTNGKLLKAAQHLKGWIEQLQIRGLSCEIIKDEEYSPLVFTEIKGDLPQTLFFYGHYDKQPPFSGWMEGLGPTNPKIIDGKLYGRGAADDGYATYSTMLALKALQTQKIPLPRCVMISEGDEESGSGHMSHYLQKLKQRIGNPLVFFCLDSGCLDYERLWLTTSLRGNMVFTMKVKTTEEGLHSGSFSGVVPSCFRIMRMLLNRLQNYKTGEIDRRFFVDIPPNRYKEMEEISQMFGKSIYDKFFPWYQKTSPISDDPLKCLIQRNWQPTVTLIGQTGFPEAQTAGSVLHSEIDVRVTVRLPPTFPGRQTAEQKLRDLLLTDIPYRAKVEIYNVRAGSGWNSQGYEPYFDSALKEASKLFFGKDICSFGMGGAIPLMGMLQNIWPGRPFLITGVLGPNSNAHGPNEFLHLPFCKKLTCCLAYIVAKSSEHLSKQ